jgi:hypothetical protein
MKRLIVINSMMVLAICLAISMSACKPDLAKVANGMQKAAVAIGAAQDITKQLFDANLIDKVTEAKILQVCIQANELGKQVDATIKAATSVDSATKNKLLSQITIISAVIDPDKISAIVDIKNADTQQKIKAGLVAVRTALTAVTLMLS